MQILKYITIAFTLLFFVSCEEVIDVDLNTAPPRLVVDAAINWNKANNGARQKIILSTSTDFYSNVIPKVSGAVVSIKNSTNTDFIFTEIPNTGEYQCTNFIPKVGETYTLTINYNGQTYTATESLQSVTSIDYIQHKKDGGFTGDEYEVKVFFQDPIVKNFYMVKFFPNFYKSPSYEVSNDEFSNGKQKSWTFSDEDLTIGSTVAITHYGISEAYYNYMNKLISVSNNSGGGSPFQTTPATVRGNVVNQTNNSNYALGYFSLSQIETVNYTLD